LSRDLPESQQWKQVLDDDEIKLSIINQVLTLDYEDLLEVYRIISLKSEEIRTKE
jgi:hypothetical protein